MNDALLSVTTRNSLLAEPERAEAWVTGRGKWVLLISLAVVFFVLLALYASVLSVLLPNQIQNIDPMGKAATLGVIYAITSVFSTLTTPMAGALSDRTRSRFGRRTPWIVGGGVIGGIAIVLVPHMPGLAGITMMWLVAVVSLNSMQPAITTLVAERFAPSERGLAAGVVGGATTAGVSVGTFIAGALASQMYFAYALFGSAIIICCGLFVAVNPEFRTLAPAADPLRMRAFLAGFWISPRRYPDFAWAFIGRFSIYMGYQGILTYLLYILQDYIGLDQGHANEMIARMALVTFCVLCPAALGAGLFSDRIGRRKPIVFASGFIMATAVLIPLVEASTRGMLVYAALIGLGYGAFMSVDLALMTQILPQRPGSEHATGKDLGILTTAINIPQILSPVMAAALLAWTANYRLLFIVAVVFVLAGSLAVWPIRSVR